MLLAIVFAVAAGLLLVACAVGLTDLRRRAALEDMAIKVRRENQTAAQLMSYMLAEWLERRDQWGHGVDKAWDAEFELDAVAVPMLDAEIRDRIGALDFVRVAIFNRAGRAIFSTERGELGGGPAHHEPFAAAHEGRIASATATHARIRALDGERADVTVVTTYLPLHLATQRGEQPDGVLAFSSDVSDAARQAARQIAEDGMLLGGAFAAIYALLVALVASGARSLTRAQRALVDSKAAAELSEARFRDLAETASDWYWESDSRHRLTFLSAGARIFADTETSIGLRVWELFADDSDTAAALAALRADLTAERPFRDRQLRARAHDGSARIWLVSGRPMLAADGRLAGYRGTGRDVTAMHAANRRLAELLDQRRREEARLAQALEREREAAIHQRRFISITAHEFRTPLTIIDGATQRILRNLETIEPRDLRERTGRIRKAVARLAEIVDKTLNSARLDEGRLDVTPSEFDLVELLRAICQRQEGLAAGVAIGLVEAQDAIAITADRALLDQVFTNLVSNAIKYSGGSRRIDVEVRCADECAVVEVRDRGIGIPEDEIPKLFTRFFRASTAKGLPGTGIGLSLVKDLVALHGGEISVASAVGHGTTFTVRLPLRARLSRVA